MSEHLKDNRAELRAICARLLFPALEHAASDHGYPPMHRAAARRELRRRIRAERGWLADFMRRTAERLS